MRERDDDDGPTEIEQTWERWHIITHIHNWAGIDALICAMQHFILQRLLDRIVIYSVWLSLAFNYVWSEEEKENLSLSLFFFRSSLKIEVKDIKQLDWQSCQFIFSFDLIFFQLLWTETKSTLTVYNLYKLNISTCMERLITPLFLLLDYAWGYPFKDGFITTLPWCFSIPNKKGRHQFWKVIGAWKNRAVIQPSSMSL